MIFRYNSKTPICYYTLYLRILYVRQWRPWTLNRYRHCARDHRQMHVTVARDLSILPRQVPYNLDKLAR